MTIAGIVLCGGRSSRMGQPKAWLPFGDELMLPRIVRILSGVANPIVVVAAPGQELPKLPTQVTIVRDTLEGRGPLGGLSAGLGALPPPCTAAYLSSCDVPFLRSAFVQRVLRAFQDSSELKDPPSVVVPRIGGYFHPLAAVYAVQVLPHVEELLAHDRLRPVFLFDRVATHVLEEPDFALCDPTFQSLRNLNTPEDYEAALAELSAVDITNENAS